MKYFSAGGLLAAVIVILNRFGAFPPWVMPLFEALAM